MRLDVVIPIVPVGLMRRCDFVTVMLVVVVVAVVFIIIRLTIAALFSIHIVGYWGPWTNAETTFSNEYYRLLLDERWSPKLSHNGTAWSGPDQYEDKTGALMMLPSDLALITDPTFRKYVELYAKDENRFFNDFSSAFAKLLELGVPFPATKAWYQFW